MALARMTYRNPWRELDSLTNRLGEMFGDFPTPSESGNWLPAVNVEETAEELLLTAELPGMTTDDIELELENNILTLRGEKNDVRRENDEGRRHHLWERRYGTFQRSFTLPRTVKADDIDAEFVDGVLHVRLPKVAEAKSRRISVRSSADNA
ncbi:MAG TPA: Hsp20/alpha crystallin family protein [Longimicrobiales bacterium]|nr:Hsp20/alpha crystallin family protein [Longimicrobiales bacterium]